jgi:nucleoside-diphosphate-sugar epimerase
MKSIILGHTSMLGRAIQTKLTNSGHDVITAGRSPESSIYIDLGDSHTSNCQPKDIREVDCIYVSASSFGGDSVEGLSQNIQINVAGCSSIAALANNCRPKSIVYAGSVFSYDGFDAYRGMSSYGLSKAITEQILGWWSERHGVRFASVRLSQLYDDYGLCSRHQPWIGRIIRYGFSKEHLYMPASEGKRNFLHIEDAADLMIEVAANSSIAGVTNGCSPSNYSYQEIAEIVFQHNRCVDRLHISKTKEAFRPVCWPKEAPLYQILKRKPRVSIDSWVKRIDRLQTWEEFGPMDVTPS